MNQPTQQRLTYIWDMATLLKFLNHRSTSVQEWAAAHILELYPEAVDEALRRLPHISGDAAFNLLDSLRDLPLSEAGGSSLNQFIRGEAKPHHKAMAAAVLIGHGKAPSENALAELPMESEYRRFQDTPSGFEFLLRQYADVSDEETGGPLTHALAESCSAHDLLAMLEDESSRKQRRRLKSLGKLWLRQLPSIGDVKERDKALGLLRDTLASSAYPDEAVRSQFPTLAAQLQKTRGRIEAIGKIAEERQQKAAKDLSHEVHLLLACALALHRDAACLEDLSSPANPMKLWLGLMLRPWTAKEVDPALVSLLENHDSEVLVSGLRHTISSHWAFCTYPFYVLRALKAPQLHQVIEEAVSGKYGDAVAEDAEKAQGEIFKDRGELGKLLEQWRKQPPEPYRLHLLGRYPTDAVVRFLLDHFEEYMSQPSSNEFVGAMERVGAQQFLKPLIKEWREGETYTGEVIWLLAELHGLERDSDIQRIQRDTEASRRMDNLLDRDNLEAALAEMPLVLPLRCKECKRTYHYKIEKVYVAKTPGEVTLGQIIQCKGCGSLETYEITQEAQPFLVAAMMLTLLQMKQKKTSKLPDSPFESKPAKITAAGKNFDSVSEAYHFLKKAVEENPQNADLHRRLGNLLHNGLRSDLALPHLEEAVRLNPNDVMALSSLADVLLALGRYEDAIPHVEAISSLCRDESMDDGLRRSAFESLIAQTHFIMEKTGRRIDLFPVFPEQLKKAAGPLHLVELDLDDPKDFEKAYRAFQGKPLPPAELAHSKRVSEPIFTPSTAPPRVAMVGRNEPCPCGSGKKYKRCHGR